MTAVSEDKRAPARAVEVSFRPRKSVDSKPIDPVDRLGRAVLPRLIAHPSVSTGHIGVAATARQATLSGYVASNAKEDAAMTATRCVEGVDQVVDDLWVAAPCPAEADPPAEAVDARPLIKAAGPASAFDLRPRGETDIGRLELRP